jgi:hypothetical protein
MTVLELLEFAALFILGSFLYHRYRRRVLARAEPNRWSSWEGGKAMDVTDLNKAMKRVRSDHLAARPLPKSTCFRRSLIVLARRAVACLPYFHARDAAHEHRS